MSTRHNPLMFRTTGEAKYFGNRGTDFAQFLKQKYGEMPVTLSTKDIPILEKWANETSKGGELGVLVSIIKRHENIQVGYFET